jgi:hypothetical protein
MSEGLPFTQRTAVRRTWLDWLLRRRPPVNALVELVKALNRGSIRDVNPGELARIAQAHAIDFVQDFHAELEHLYREYLTFCMQDRHLTDDELANLNHLASLFRLQPAMRATIQRNVTRQVYLKSVSEVLEDGTIDEQERDFLRKLQEQLAIPPADAENILAVRQRQLGRAAPKRR